MRNLLGLVFILILSSVPGLSQSQPPPEEELSLAELAAKERQRRAELQQESRLITNADLNKFKDSNVSGAGSHSPASGETEPLDETTEETDLEATAVTIEEAGPEDIEFWQAAFAEARQAITSAVNRDLVLQLRMNNLRNAFFAEDDGNTQGLIQAQLQQTLEHIEKNREQLRKAKVALDSLIHAARNAGVAPGVIREMVGEIPELQPIVTETTPNPGG